MSARILLIGMWIVIILAFIGCGSESPNVPEPPSNLWFSYGSDDLEVILHWQQSASQNIDGYKIYLGNELVGSVGADSTTFSDYPEFLGTYSVTAYADESESQRASIELPEVWSSSDVTLDSRGLCAYQFNGEPPYIARRSIIRYSGYDIFYGDSTNQYLADSVDFYFDTTLTLQNPQKIVREGRWTYAFHTRFYRIAENADEQVLDTLSIIPRYDDSLFSDSLSVHRGDLIAIACFENDEPAISADKRYAIIYLTAVNDTAELHKTITFSYLAQSDKNYRLVKVSQ